MDLWVIFRLACSLEYAATAPQRSLQSWVRPAPCFRKQAFGVLWRQKPGTVTNPLEGVGLRTRPLCRWAPPLSRYSWMGPSGWVREPISGLPLIQGNGQLSSSYTLHLFWGVSYFKGVFKCYRSNQRALGGREDVALVVLLVHTRRTPLIKLHKIQSGFLFI